MRIYISDLKDHVGQTIELKGWAHQTRSSGKVKFLELIRIMYIHDLKEQAKLNNITLTEEDLSI